MQKSLIGNTDSIPLSQQHFNVKGKKCFNPIFKKMHKHASPTLTSLYIMMVNLTKISYQQ